MFEIELYLSSRTEDSITGSYGHVAIKKFGSFFVDDIFNVTKVQGHIHGRRQSTGKHRVNSQLIGHQLLGAVHTTHSKGVGQEGLRIFRSW